MWWDCRFLKRPYVYSPIYSTFTSHFPTVETLNHYLLCPALHTPPTHTHCPLPTLMPHPLPTIICLYPLFPLPTASSPPLPSYCEKGVVQHYGPFKEGRLKRKSPAGRSLAAAYYFSFDTHARACACTHHCSAAFPPIHVPYAGLPAAFTFSLPLFHQHGGTGKDDVTVGMIL